MSQAELPSDGQTTQPMLDSMLDSIRPPDRAPRKRRGPAPQHGWFQLLLGVPSTVSAPHRRTYYVVLIGAYVAALLHISWLFTFAALQVLPLFWFNIGSSLYWLIVIYLFRRRGMVLVGMTLASIEVIAHQAFAIYLLGWDYGFQYYCIVVVSYMCLGYFRRLYVPLATVVLSILAYFGYYYRVQYLLEPHLTLASGVQNFFYVTNLVSVFFLIASFSYVYSYAALKAEVALEKEREKSENLLLNILPQSVAQRLKQDQSVIADHFQSTSVLFADIVGFTHVSEKLTPTEVVIFLNVIFSSFDDLVEKYALEKIKTVGDAYMVAGGFPEVRHDHLEAIADLALEMLVSVSQFNDTTQQPFDIRIGIHTGPAVAGVIGIKKFVYDVWGDTVNTASRMESHGVPGRIHVSEQTYAKLCEKYHLQERGVIDVKGKGPMKTYFLCGKAASHPHNRLDELALSAGC